MKEQYYNDINTSCHWKTLAPFCLQKKTPENAFLTLTVNYRRIIQKEGGGAQDAGCRESLQLFLFLMLNFSYIYTCTCHRCTRMFNITYNFILLNTCKIQAPSQVFKYLTVQKI